MVFTPEIIEKVWEKGIVVEDQNDQEFRKDIIGAWIGRRFYNNKKNQFGWVIGYIRPIEKGGSNHIDNLIPLQWENNNLINQGVTDRKVTANRIRNELITDVNHGQDTH
ncbi:MAG TPA: hypothetical protein PKA78_14125 [Macellibacteroides fermentans]|jgi:hypothetical protein|uniref:hypothetical protein n=1 Tax=Macellibacteroides fermentans TaxID=879969 RepID=UPI002C5726F6|nr:hypothetical protein [Macellibacteroides fermentans]